VEKIFDQNLFTIDSLYNFKYLPKRAIKRIPNVLEKAISLNIWFLKFFEKCLIHLNQTA